MLIVKMREKIKTITSFIKSSNRSSNEKSYNFSIDYPDGVLTCNGDEYMEINVISFDMINTIDKTYFTNLDTGSTGIGNNVLNSNVGMSNNAFGTNALKSNINGSNNVAFGYQSLQANTQNTNISSPTILDNNANNLFSNSFYAPEYRMNNFNLHSNTNTNFNNQNYNMINLNNLKEFLIKAKKSAYASGDEKFVAINIKRLFEFN
jgi:hypothetical protein